MIPSASWGIVFHCPGYENIFTEHKMCVLTFSSVSVVSHSKKKAARYVEKNVHWFACELPVILGRF